MRILDLTNHGPGGERHESRMSCLAHRQALGGHDVTALTSTPHLVEGQTSADAGPVEVIPATSTTMGVRRTGSTGDRAPRSRKAGQRGRQRRRRDTAGRLGKPHDIAPQQRTSH